MTFKKTLLAAVLLLRVVSGYPALVDTNVYRMVFVSPVDTCFIADDSLRVKIAVYDQTDASLAGETPLLTVRAMSSGGAGTLVNLQAMTDNGDGTYSYPALNIVNRPNTYFDLRVRINVKSMRIENRVILYHGVVSGNAETPWRIEFVNAHPVMNGDSNTVIMVKAFNAAGLPDTGRIVTLSVTDSGNQLFAIGAAMTPLGDGLYTDTLFGALLNDGEDYTIRASTGTLTATVQSQLCVEVFKTRDVPAEKGPRILTPCLSVYPNPLSGSLRVTLTGIARNTNGPVNIYDVSGKLVKTLKPMAMTAGSYTVVWDATGNANEKMGTGLYVVRALVNGKVLERKILNIK